MMALPVWTTDDTQSILRWNSEIPMSATPIVRWIRLTSAKRRFNDRITMALNNSEYPAPTVIIRKNQ
jgi:hypothetical protein